MKANYNSHWNAVFVKIDKMTYLLDIDQAKKLRDELDKAISEARI